VVAHVLNKAIKKWGQSATDAALKEMKQLQNRKCFVLMHVHTLTKEECRCIMHSLLFLTEKQDGAVEARHCADGSIQQNCVSSESMASLTVCAELVLLSAAIDAARRRARHRSV